MSGHRRHEDHRLVQEGMVKRELMRVQTQWVGDRRFLLAIEGITHDRKAGGEQVEADLVGTSSAGMNPQETCAIAEVLLQIHVGLCVLSVGSEAATSPL